MTRGGMRSGVLRVSISMMIGTVTGAVLRKETLELPTFIGRVDGVMGDTMKDADVAGSVV